MLDPEVPKLLSLLFGVRSPAAPRDDLVTIFLKGIPGLNQPPNVTPSEMLRLNVAIPPARFAESARRARLATPRASRTAVAWATT